MEKRLETFEMKTKQDVKSAMKYQYVVTLSENQEFYGPLCDTVVELDAWFEKTFMRHKNEVDNWEK